jgi:hypothetical protein
MILHEKSIINKYQTISLKNLNPIKYNGGARIEDDVYAKKIDESSVDSQINQSADHEVQLNLMK